MHSYAGQFNEVVKAQIHTWKGSFRAVQDVLALDIRVKRWVDDAAGLEKDMEQGPFPTEAIASNTTEKYKLRCSTGSNLY